MKYNNQGTIHIKYILIKYSSIPGSKKKDHHDLSNSKNKSS